MPAQTLNLGVIGAGRIGRLHAENLATQIPAARLVAIADVREDAARHAAERCPGARALDDPAALLDDHAIEAVVICSSTDSHAELIEQAALRGKHVFCEKPIALDPQRTAQALRACERAGVCLQVGFNRRFDPSFRRVAERVASGEIGPPQLVRITSRDPAPPPLEYLRVSGGLFVDMAIHDLDMARYLVADEVVEVFATGACLIDSAIGAAGDVDTAVTTLRFAKGALAAIDNARHTTYGYDQRLEVLGPKGCLIAGNRAPTAVSVWNGQGKQADLPHAFFLDRYRESYLAELEAFVQCARTGTPAPVGGQDGLRALTLALAAKQSLAEGRPVRVASS